MNIRMATADDAEELLEIYAPYVLNTAITFEYAVPTVQEFRSRINNILSKYPYIVTVENGAIVGYAYAGTFKGRSAYDWSVETSIYLKENCRGMGYGKKLYQTLEEILKRQNIVNLYACITYAEVEDEYHNNASMRFHERMGYRLIGKFQKCGYKYDRWYDMIWMERFIGEHKTPDNFIPVTELDLSI